MIGAKAGRNGHHLFQAQSEQCRACEQNKSERDLRHDKSVAKALSGATDRARARFRLQRMRKMVAQVEPGDRHREDNSENHSANETDGRQPAIKRDVRAERQTIGAENFEEANSPGAHAESEQSADHGEEDGLNHRLIHHMPTARAHRLTDRHFFRAPARADQKEVHQINRPDQQKKKYPGLHQQKGWANGPHVIGAKAGLGHHLRFRIVLLDRGVVRVDL